MRVNRSPLRSLLTALVVISVTFSALAVTGGSASAVVPVAPSGLAPNGDELSAGSRPCRGQRVSDATSYDVQVSSSPTFVPVSWSDSTVSTSRVPTAQPKVGVIYWRVRARNSSGPGEWTTATFNRGAVDAPVVSSPADGASAPAARQSAGLHLAAHQRRGPVHPADLARQRLHRPHPARLLHDACNDLRAARPSAPADVLLAREGSARRRQRVRHAVLVGALLHDPRSQQAQPRLPSSTTSTTTSKTSSSTGRRSHGAATYELQISTDVNFLTIVDEPGPGFGARDTRRRRP